MARPRGFIPRSPRSKRVTSWGFGPGDSALTSITATGQTVLGAGVALTLESKATVIRLRGQLDCYLIAAAAASDAFVCALGVGIVSNDAFQIGVTAMPEPIGDSSWPGWLYHHHFSLLQRTATEDNIFGGGTGYRLEVDSKAMRKIGQNEVLTAILDVVELGTGPAMEVAFNSRILLKLT